MISIVWLWFDVKIARIRRKWGS